MKHLQKALDKIKKMILSLGAMVEERVHQAKQAMDTIDVSLAQHIIRLDHEIDEMEVEIEEECLKILALHQPVAVDLRFLVAVIKINNDLERIADLAVNIAQRVKSIARDSSVGMRYDYSEMVTQVEAMLQNSLDSLVNLDADQALRVCLQDDEIDAMKETAHEHFKTLIKDHPDQAGPFIDMLLISRHLERIADHATNIAEEVIYMIEGEIVRHGLE
jgi:phosphate transport system protein